MRIALISTPYATTPPTSAYAGIEVVVADLAAALAELGHDVTLFATEGSKPIGNYKVIEYMNKRPNIEGKYSQGEQIGFEHKLFNRAQKYFDDFDVVNIHGINVRNYDTKKFIFYTTHMTVGGHYPRNAVVSTVSRIMCQRIAEIYRSKGSDGIMEFVHNGIDLSKYPFQKEKGDRLLCVGRITPNKNTHVAIKVASDLGVDLDVVGSVYNREYFDDLYKDSKGARFHLNASHEEKIKLMQNARCLLVPSVESFGLAGLETMACGTPVVCMDIGAIKEIVLDGISGFVCKDLKTMEHAVGLVDLMKPYNCRNVAERFSREKMAEGYISMYNKYLGEGS